MQIVEFIGPPKAGKSATISALNKKDNAVQIGSEFSFLSLVSDPALQSRVHSIISYLPTYLQKKLPHEQLLCYFRNQAYRHFTDDLAELTEKIFTSLLPLDIHAQKKLLYIERFLTNATQLHYQLQETPAKVTLLNDEFFLQKTILLPEDSFLPEFLKLQKNHFVIYIRPPIEVCQARIDATPTELVQPLTRHYTHYDDLVNKLTHKYNMKVHTVHNPSFSDNLNEIAHLLE